MTYTSVRHKRGTSTQWASATYVLKDGEIGIDTTLNKIKVGNGTSLWPALSWASLNNSDLGVANGVATLDSTGNIPVSQLGNLIDGAPSALNTLNELAAAINDNESFASTITTSLSEKAPLNSPSFTGTVNFADATISGLHEVSLIQSSNNSLYPLTISSANQQNGGAGYSDLIKLVNTKSGATNPNKFLRITDAGALQIVNSAYTATNMSLDNDGNVTFAGYVRGAAAGSVLKDTMLNNSEVTVVSTTIATSTSNVDFITYNYTPVSSSSYLIIDVHISRYEHQGTTDDSWYSVLKVDGSEISYNWQMVNDNGTGTSGRSGVLFPLTGRYTNSSTSAKTIAVAARRDTADDSITITNSATSIWLRITEVAR